ncbi:hypothetical protein QW71_35680 [Paenibacillus sp. IHB B 3415]|nr:hypothetical protein QW71_35680 [Paenibacillus sp. IHB B 3415]
MQRRDRDFGFVLLRTLFSRLFWAFLIIIFHLLVIFFLRIRLENFDFHHAVSLLPTYFLPVLCLLLNTYLYFNYSSKKRKFIWAFVSTIPSGILLFYIKNSYNSSVVNEPIFNKYSIELGIYFPLFYLIFQFVLLLAWLSDWKSRKDNVN